LIRPDTWSSLVMIIAVTGVALFPVAAGSSHHFEMYSVEIRPGDDLVSETIRFLIVNDGNETLNKGSYTIGAGIEQFKVTDEEGVLKSSVIEAGDSSTIQYEYREPLLAGGSETVTISFKAKGMIGESTYVDGQGVEHQDRVISTGLLAPAPMDELNVRVRLPDGAWLARSMNRDETAIGAPVRPLDVTVLSNGTSLSLFWTRENVAENERFELYVAYNVPGRMIKIDTAWVIGGVLVGVLVGGVAVFMFMRRRSGEKRVEHTLALLEEGERKVLQTIMDQGGEMRQDDLVEATGYSKARVSQLVTHLEKLRLIRKERFERTNKLFLTGDVREI